MATKRTVPDEFSNIVYSSVTESAANTLTFQKIETGYGSLQKTAWILQRIEWYFPEGTLNLILDNADVISAALCTSNQIDSLGLDQAALIDLMNLSILYKSGIGFFQNNQPFVRDFSNLAGGGRIILPYPLYVAVKGTSLASAITVACRMFFTEKDLSDSDWMELVQQTRLLS